MHCQKCGTENLGDAQICQGCGGIFVYSETAKTCGLAVTSMILGISGFSMFVVFGITWIIGLIFGIIALNKITKSDGRLKGKGWAITGIITSGAGLALVLTIFGVWMFVSSVKTASLHRKFVDLQTGMITTDDLQGTPTIEGIVSIVLTSDKQEQSSCDGKLFLPSDTKKDFSSITRTISCSKSGDEPYKASWQFAGVKEEGDKYDFVVSVPFDNDGSVGSKSVDVVYDGSKQIIYENQNVKIIIAPAREPEDVQKISE